MCYGSLSELQLSLGRIKAAVADAHLSIDYADRSGDAFRRMGMRTTLADALHQHGEAAAELLAEAEGIQAQRQPAYLLLYSLQGFRHCELLLAPAERAAWRVGFVGRDSSRQQPPSPEYVGLKPDLQVCAEVQQRAAQTLAWAETNDIDKLSVALDHLTLARCALYADLLQRHPPGEDAQTRVEHALSGLQNAGAQEFIVRGLLTRAWLRAALGAEAGARANLNEAERIASRGGMKLFLADIALHRARLFRDRTELAKARALIMECEYFRRLPELEDAEKALGLSI